MDKTKPPSLFTANKKADKIDTRLMKSIGIKKEIPKERPPESKAMPSLEKTVEKKGVGTKTDQRKFNQRPPLSADESFYSVADKQTRISSYLKILVQLVEELSFIEPKQLSITQEKKWEYNSDSSIPKIANSFNGVLVQIIEDFVANKSEREQEIFITALQKEIDKEKKKS